ncbi:hypothetical protein P4520_22475 [Bacillus thuringiensis]|nr:hypothetical protein [Bacillus thuringiensis]MED3635617.1 hypothetical protein [Bacillus thuringiensis]
MSFSGKSSIEVGTFTADLTRDSVTHVYIQQEFIITTEDKLQLHLTDYKNRLEKRQSWIAPASILFTLFATLLTADFKNAFGIPSSTWQALFILVTVITIVWFLNTLRYAFCKNVSVEDLVNELKEKSQNQKSLSSLEELQSVMNTFPSEKSSKKPLF